ncbi:MAG: 1-deoxy-D-xylulose-5-phosphate synthase, partial [Treponema sp.]|nr:1-deoxy-D-xylulose-5-phosphate synthase [Treponema sp.]
AVPDDGCTHQGIFDISLFRPIPDLQIMSPVSAKDLELCFDWAVNSEKAVVIRYPKLPCPEEIKEFEQPVSEGRGILIRNSFQKKNTEASILIVCTGGMYSEVWQAVKALDENSVFSDILVLRFIKPFDEKYFVEVAKKYKGILFVEDGIVTGGISEYLRARLIENHIINSEILAFEEKYYNHANRAQILEDAGLSPEHIQKAAMGLLNASPSFKK